MKIHRVIPIALLLPLLLLRADAASAQQNAGLGMPAAGTGLEIKDYQSVHVSVPSLSADAAKIGLTQERIVERVNAKLTAGGLKPAEYRLDDAYLNVEVIVVGAAFSTSIEFARVCTYPSASGALMTGIGKTWSDGLKGTYGGDAEHILQAIDISVAKFIAEYTKANGK